jgi:hypothetical protein
LTSLAMRLVSSCRPMVFDEDVVVSCSVLSSAMDAKSSLERTSTKVVHHYNDPDRALLGL